jgi:hypothetical protein
MLDGVDNFVADWHASRDFCRDVVLCTCRTELIIPGRRMTISVICQPVLRSRSCQEPHHFVVAGVVMPCGSGSDGSVIFSEMLQTLIFLLFAVHLYNDLYHEKS